MRAAAGGAPGAGAGPLLLVVALLALSQGAPTWLRCAPCSFCVDMTEEESDAYAKSFSSTND